MRRLLRDNGLTIAMFGLFFVFVSAQSIMGFLDYNSTEKEHGHNLRLVTSSIWEAETSSKPSSKTGRASSCRWVFTSCLLLSFFRGVRLSLKTLRRSTRMTLVTVKTWAAPTSPGQ